MTRSLPPVVNLQPGTENVAPPLAERPQAPDSPALTLRKLLPKSCLVVEMSPTSLLVKSGRPIASISLFEEAIALSKLRGILYAKPSIPKASVQRTVLRDGTAVIPFGKSVPPSDAAAAILSALSLDGVQRVRALLDVD